MLLQAYMRLRNLVTVCLRRYPELAVLSFSLTAVLSGWALGLPISPPNLSAGEAILHDYLLPLGIVAVVHLVLLLRSSMRRKSSAVVLVLSIPTLLVVTYCHFQCKIWMPLINPNRFGGDYESVDRLLAPLVSLCSRLTRLTIHSGINVSAAYHGWFIIFFFVCFGLHSLYDTTDGQRQVILGVGCILALGGVCYWIAPALGPFTFRLGSSTNATLIQDYMWKNFNLLVRTSRIPPGYFLDPPAAMPSLHIAHAAFLIWMLRRISRPLSFLMAPVLLWFMVSAVGLAWHYVLDIPAGLLLAAVSAWLVVKMLPDEQSRRETEPVLARHVSEGDPVAAA